MIIEIPRQVLESAILTCNNKDHRELCKTVIIIPKSNNVDVYAVDGKRLFKAELKKQDVNLPSPLTQPICLFSENLKVALKQLKQSMGRNAKNIDTFLITYDPAKPFIAFLSIEVIKGKCNLSRAYSELKIPVDLVDNKETIKNIVDTVENVFNNIQNDIKNKLANDNDKAKFCYYLPFVNYLTEVLDIMGEEFLKLNAIKITENNSLNYMFTQPAHDVYIDCKVHISLTGYYE